MKFPRLAPGSVGNDELDGRRLLPHQFLIQFDGVLRGVRHQVRFASGSDAVGRGETALLDDLRGGQHGRRPVAARPGGHRSGGAGGAAVFIDDALQRGQSGTRATVGVVWVLIADLVSLVPFILYGNVFLYQHQALKFYDVLGVGVFIFFVAGLCFLLVLAGWQVKILRGVLGVVQRLANRVAGWFKHPTWLGEEWPSKTAKELADAVHTFLTNPRWMVYSLLVGLFLHILNLAGLYILFLAFQQPVQLGTLVSGFGMGVVFYVVTILPQGVGTVLGIMTLVFNSMGIPKANALVITLTFRGLNFWLPVLCGFLLIRSLSRFKSTSG